VKEFENRLILDGVTSVRKLRTYFLVDHRPVYKHDDLSGASRTDLSEVEARRWCCP